MNIYIACHNQRIARRLGALLRRNGYGITSRWLDQPFGPANAFDEELRWKFANENLDDVRHSDVLVLIAGAEKYSGGKFVETGFAYALGKPVIILGRRENVQCYGHHMCLVRTRAELLKTLQSTRKAGFGHDVTT